MRRWGREFREEFTHTHTQRLREGGRERRRGTYTYIQTHTHRQANTDTGTHRDTNIYTHIHSQIHIQIDIHHTHTHHKYTHHTPSYFFSSLRESHVALTSALPAQSPQCIASFLTSPVVLFGFAYVFILWHWGLTLDLE